MNKLKIITIFIFLLAGKFAHAQEEVNVRLTQATVKDTLITGYPNGILITMKDADKYNIDIQNASIALKNAKAGYYEIYCPSASAGKTATLTISRKKDKKVVFTRSYEISVMTQSMLKRLPKQKNN